MVAIKASRIDPPSPPRPPNPPPPSPETKKTISLSAQQKPVSRSRQDPPSPPRAPPPSPTKTTTTLPTTPNTHMNSESSESFPRLVELTMTLGDVLDLTPTQISRRDSYLYCEDDMSVPGSPPPLDFSTPKPKCSTKRRAEDLKDCDLFGPCLAETPASDHKRRKAIDLDDTILFLPSNSSSSRTRQIEFFSTLFSGGQLNDTTLLHEHVHGVQGCV